MSEEHLLMRLIYELEGLLEERLDYLLLGVVVLLILTHLLGLYKSQK